MKKFNKYFNLIFVVMLLFGCESNKTLNNNVDNKNNIEVIESESKPDGYEDFWPTINIGYNQHIEILYTYRDAAFNLSDIQRNEIFKSCPTIKANEEFKTTLHSSEGVDVELILNPEEDTGILGCNLRAFTITRNNVSSEFDIEDINISEQITFNSTKEDLINTVWAPIITINHSSETYSWYWPKNEENISNIGMIVQFEDGVLDSITIHDGYLQNIE